MLNRSTTPAPPQNLSSACDQPTSINNVVYSLFLCLVLAVACLGNGFVCLVIYCCRRLRSHLTNYFVFSLAISDIAVASLAFPVRIFSSVNNHKFCGSLNLCIYYNIIDITCSVASITNLLIIAVDRFLLLHFPYKYPSLMTKKKTFCIAVGIWIYSFAWALVSIFSWEKQGKRSITIQNHVCFNENKYYVTIVMTIVYFIPLAIMGMIYAGILKMARSHARLVVTTEVRLINSEAEQARKNRKRKRERKATVTLAIVFGAFVVCWLPNCIIAIVSNWCRDCFANLYKNHENLFFFLSITFVEVLPPFNSTVNPFIYGVHNRQFREAYKDFFTRKKQQFTDSDNNLTFTHTHKPRTPQTSPRGSVRLLHRITRKESCNGELSSTASPCSQRFTLKASTMLPPEYETSL